MTDINVSNMTARERADAAIKAEAEFWSGFLANGGMMARRKYDALCNELNLDPLTVERRDVWAAMLQRNHRLCRATRDPATGCLIEPPDDSRLEKLQALADRPGTVGEGQAAQAAIDRITGGAA